MTKESLRRNLLLIIVPLAVILLTAVVIVALQSQSSVKAPGEGEVTIRGEAMCLPHKNTDGPQTLECAFGLKDEKGQYYGLSDSDPNYKNVSSMPMGKKVEISGTFEKGTSEKYPTIGTLHVTKVTQN